jgi:hypothetical protein
MIAKVCVVSPAPPGSRNGNRITALRWARILRDLGRRVTVAEEYRGGRCDLMVALHALRSAVSVDRYRSSYPDAPLIVALTGTDLYDSLHTHPEARRAVDLATRLIVLQPLGLPDVGKRGHKPQLTVSRQPSGDSLRLGRGYFRPSLASTLKTAASPPAWIDERSGRERSGVGRQQVSRDRLVVFALP